MASNLEEIMQSILEELQAMRSEMGAQQGSDSTQEKNAKTSQVSDTTKEKESDRVVAQKTVGRFDKFSSAYQSGDIRNMGMALGQVFGEKGGAAAGFAAEAASLFSPRGYNAFNIFERYDRTKVEPYKQLENLVYEYGRYGKEIPEDQLKQSYQRVVEANEKGFGQVERLRGLINTNALSPMLESIGIGGGKTVEDWVKSGTTNMKRFVAEPGEDKAQSVSQKSSNMQKSVNRVEKFDDK